MELVIFFYIIVLVTLFFLSKNNFFLLFIFLVFSDYIIIQAKYLLTLPEFVSSIKDLLLIFLSLHYIRKKNIFSFYTFSFLFILLLVISINDTSVRIIINIISIFIIGYLEKYDFSFGNFKLFFVSLFLFLICLNQYFNITKFEDFWFYNYLYNKMGEEFLTTIYGYFRNEIVRTPGILVSTGIMALLFFSIIILLDQNKKINNLSYFFTKILAFSGILFTQTRAILILFIIYEIFRYFIKLSQIRFLISFSYVSILGFVFFLINYYGDDGALARILLWLNYLNDILNLNAFVPFSNQILIFQPKDSQLITFLNFGGIFSIIILTFGLFKIYSWSLSLSLDTRYLSLLLFCILFVLIFQWSGDSVGLLILIYIFGNLLSKRT